MEKYGWQAGKGLGKNLDGMKDFIRVSKKDDRAGIGRSSYSLLDFSHWDDLYKKAAQNIQVQDTQGKVQLTTGKSEEAPKKQSVYGGMFVKASQSMEATPKAKIDENDLFAICGNRELRMYRQEGKNKRVKKFDQDFKEGVLPEEPEIKGPENITEEEPNDNTKSHRSKKGKKRRISRADRPSKPKKQKTTPSQPDNLQ
uniref:G-patch domain-containing protein n=1 Tax=Arcella intermedia TaxID=1963864 RepID=A0A6B2LK40_9EUKA